MEKKVFKENRSKEQVDVVALLISDKTDFKLKQTRRNREGYYMKSIGRTHEKFTKRMLQF